MLIIKYLASFTVLFTYHFGFQKRDNLLIIRVAGVIVSFFLKSISEKKYRK